MRFPFVSRGRFEDSEKRADELRAQIAELKAELKDSREELTRVGNYWTWRTAGAPIHPEMIPQEYRIQPAGPETASGPGNDEVPSEMQEVIKKVGRHPREIVKSIQGRRNGDAAKVAPPALAQAAALFESDLKTGRTA